MLELRQQIGALLRSELAGETAAGMSRLRRIPSTQVIRLVDYLADLDPGGREDLLDPLAHFGSASFFPELAAAESVQRQQHPVFGRYLSAMAFRGFGGGYRYTPMKLLAGISKDTAVGGLEGWIKNSGFAGLELQPREDLLPNLDCLKPVAPAKLRKLIDTAFAGLFSPQKAKIASDHTRYIGVYKNARLAVDVLFAPKPHSPKQLHYILRIAPGEGFTWNFASYEGLWSLRSTWDYLTEENAGRSIELLADLVAYLVGLATRVHDLKKG